MAAVDDERQQSATAAFRALAAVLVFAVVFFVPLCVAAQAAPCSSPAMFVVAHEDDDLLFQSPSLLRTIASNRCVRTVFVTAGDAGLGRYYWAARERGAQAAYAQMAHVASDWTASTINVQGHPILLETLTGRPDISLVFMRLPNGAADGTGTALYGNQSLEKLWNGGNPDSSGGPAISRIAAVDGSTSYGYDDLIRTLGSMMTSFQPRRIASQDYRAAFSGDDHSDHVAAARFAELAHLGYTAPHDFVGYKDYGTSSLLPNVFGSQLDAKRSAFYIYGSYDSHTCAGDASCASTSYAGWLQRQYVVGSEPVGVVANAGYTDIAYAGDTVTLDGSLSSAAGGAPLQYAWIQVGGPAVALSGRETAFPSFVVPSGPASLSFSLTVSTGSTTSAADVVTITVAAGRDPVPVAFAGPAQAVPSGASVTLDGLGSRDPYDQPLTYTWTQIAGPLVGLSSPSSTNPVFTAPPGPAILVFSLIVSNNVASSSASTVTVSVGAASPLEGNVALMAAADASSQTTADGQVAGSAIDGVIGGYPALPTAEWATAGEGAGGFLRLSWPTSMVLDHAVLYDRPNHDDQITSGTLSFSDGSRVGFGALPDEAATGRLVTFSPRATTRLVMTITGVSPTTLNAGLAELEAWGAPAEAPSVTSAAATAFTIGAAGSFIVTSQAFPPAVLTHAGPLPEGVDFIDHGDGTATLAGTPRAGTAGIYPITLTADNGLGEPSVQHFTLTVLEVPRITSASSARFTVGSEGSFTVTSNGHPAPVLTESGTLPGGLSFVDHGDGTAVLSGTPSAPGATTIELVAANAAGSARQSFAVVVGAVPAFSSAPSAVATAGALFRANVAARGAPTPALTAANALPSWLTLVDSGNGTAILSGLPPSDAHGDYSFTLRATNSEGAATQVFTLTVLAADVTPPTTPDPSRPPVFTTAGSGSAIVGKAVHIDIAASGFPAPELSLVAPVPRGLRFTATSPGGAMLSGTPTIAGTFRLDLEARNVIGVASQAFTLVVDRKPTLDTRRVDIVPRRPSRSVIVVEASPRARVSLSGRLHSGIRATVNVHGDVVVTSSRSVIRTGRYRLVVHASNRAGSVRQVVRVRVRRARPPALSVARSATVTVGQPFRLIVSASGFPAPRVSSSGELPDGVELTTTATGVTTLAGRPSVPGSFPLQFSATNGSGTARQTFVLVVRLTTTVPVVLRGAWRTPNRPRASGSHRTRAAPPPRGSRRANRATPAPGT